MALVLLSQNTVSYVDIIHRYEVVQLFTLTRHKIQVPMSIYALKTVPVPTDTETYLWNSVYYMLMSLLYKYMVVTFKSNITLKHQCHILRNK